MQIDLATFLSSTVIVAIISALITLFSNKHKSILDNITLERKEWRNKIRVIVEELEKCNTQNDILNIANKLKVYLNAYGISNNNLYGKDGHIWGLFTQISSLQNNKQLISYKTQLIEYLSCLLKFDWERSKQEVKGNNYITFIIALHISFGLIACFLTDSLFKNKESISFIVIFFLTSSMCYILILLSKKEIYNKITKDFFIYYLLEIVITLLLISIIIYLFVYLKLYSNQVIFLCIMTLVISTLIVISETITRYKEAKEYENTINSIKINFEMPQNEKVK